MRRLALWALCGVAGAQQAVLPTAAGPVLMRPAEKLTANADALPTLVAGPAVTEAVAAKINAALRKVDARTRAQAKVCGDGDWASVTQVTMRGPRYFSVTVSVGGFCAGPHPYEETLALVYDLENGESVSWLKLLPRGATGRVDELNDGTKSGVVVWPLLSSLARRGASKDCREWFAPEATMGFALSLDAKADAVIAQPVDLPYASNDCAEGASISVAAARKMGGFNGAMLDALEAAHRLQ